MWELEVRTPVAAIIVSLAALLSVSTALADDWTAVRLRGGVFALENGAWTQLVRGSVISDDRVIKSAPGGRITLVRGAETIELGPDTTAQISDRAGFTTVYNHEGTVGIDAEARNVQHFAVQTAFLAAVVKGTAFTVQSKATASTVTVARGTVEVDDEQNHTSVNVDAGEQVSSSQDAPITAESVVPAPPNAPEPPAPAALQPQVSPINTSPTALGVSENPTQTVNGTPGSNNGNPGGNLDTGSDGGTGAWLATTTVALRRLCLAATDQEAMAQAATDLAEMDLVAMDLVATDLAETDRAAMDLAAMDRAVTDRAAMDLGATDLGATDLAETDLEATDRAATDLAATDLVATDLAATDLVATDLVGTDLAGTDLAGTVMTTVMMMMTKVATGMVTATTMMTKMTTAETAMAMATVVGTATGTTAMATVAKMAKAKARSNRTTVVLA